MLTSMGEAKEWLLSPRLPKWLLAPLVAVSTAWVPEEDELAVVAVQTADGVIELSDDDGLINDSAEEESRSALRRVAQALPPPPPLQRTILSLASIQDFMALPVVFQRHPATGGLVRADRTSPSARPGGSSWTTGYTGVSASRGGPPSTTGPAGPPASLSGSSSTTGGVSPSESRSGSSSTAVRAGPSSSLGGLSFSAGASLLTPPSPAPLLWSLASGAPRERGRCTPWRGPASSFGPARSVTTADCSLPAALASVKGASEARSAMSRQCADRSGGSGSWSVSPSDEKGPPPSSALSQTRRRVATEISPIVGPPTKKLRPAESLPFHMGRLAKSILGRKKGLFVTGGGGVGKTRLLRQCVEEHRQALGGSRDGLHVVAPTGVAAAAAGGVTIHSYLSLCAGCFDESLSEEQDAARLYNAMDGMTKRRMADTSLLLLEEVSMVSSRIFTVLVYSIENAHVKMNNNLQWRIVAFGDIFQLPPVREDEDHFDSSGLHAFKFAYWGRLFQNKQLHLRYVWRQEDKMLIAMLSRVRVGDVCCDLEEFLNWRSAVYKARAEAGDVLDMGVTRIFPHRHRVRAHNLDSLSKLEKTNRCTRAVYQAIDYPIGVNMTVEQVTVQLDASIMAPKKLEVCVGARVAACATISEEQVEVPNGTVSIVIGYKGLTVSGLSSQEASVPIVRFETVRGAVVVTVTCVDMKLQSVSRDGAYASRYQIPLVLAWAVTVHRCQGLSMDAAVLHWASCFLDGMVTTGT
ncbi:hypothetical protein I4F81_001843 [Pyropia yezoensis]|uniref:Uncharacterized protein n=1 Tax=Pyropia yezoensis TaxID=2788 RepID=A0ACC3BMR2_PYRYE|nr:hypothetical protein I4F81_001843 [Neopyropia yezoensis]